MDWQRLFAYDDWANHEEVTRLRAIGSQPDRAVKLLAHIIGAQWVWLSRLRGTAAKMAVWPDLTLQAGEAELAALREEWRRYLETAALEGSISYRNSKGEQWSSRIDDVLMHVVFHGAYHRGQMAAVVRASGNDPAYTDYIQCTRIGAI
jgi:uncharacterized damage-inducible protein DinB